MATVHARRASSLAVLVVITTGFAGGRGWVAGRASDQVPKAEVPPVEAPIVEAPIAGEHAGHDGHAGHGSPPADDTPPAHGHHGHHGPQAASGTAGGHKSHSHDCENGICRCDSKCPPRRGGPCGGALRSCSTNGDEAGVGPGPARPFLLAAAIQPQPVFDSTRRPDATFLPLTRDLDPVSPPPRTSAV